MEIKESGQKMTISDVAEALNISKTTVSRAISGKGRIGAETRRRVLEYIEEHNYKPSVIAKGLAQSKSYNIGWVMPSDYSVVDLPFFQKCLMGLLEMAAPVDYDVLVCTVSPDDMSQLESDKSVLCIDYRQNGIGSNSCGPELDEKYRFDEDEWEFGFTMHVK